MKHTDFPSGNVLAVKGGYQSRLTIVIECSFEGGKMVTSSRASLHADRVTFLEGRSFILGGELLFLVDLTITFG